MNSQLEVSVCALPDCLSLPPYLARVPESLKDWISSSLLPCWRCLTMLRRAAGAKIRALTLG